MLYFFAEYFVIIVTCLAIYVLATAPRAKLLQALWSGIFVIPLTYLFAYFLNQSFFNPRPDGYNLHESIVGLIDRNGFPSGHTLYCAVIAILITIINKKIGLIFWLFALIIGSARVLIGVHHWLDIFTSLALCGLIYFFVKFFYFKKPI